MTEIVEITTWFTNAHGNGRVAHQAYWHHHPNGETTLITYCGRPLPTPQQVTDTTPRCKSCLRSLAVTR